MPATPITDPVTGESLVGTEPQLDQQVDPGYWRQRLNLYTGRALTVSALDSEQDYRAGLLATMGQAVTAGTVTGLALTMNTSGPDPVFTVAPGYGITAGGQDVVLNTTLKTALSTLTVIDPVTGSDLYTFHQSVGDPTNTTYAGILLLQPVIAQVSGQLLDSGSQPAIVSGNLSASCSQDPAEYAFEDWQIADAVRLVYLPWPAGVPALPLPPSAPETTWRNRLAYAIFNAEALLGSDDQLPWAMLGLPVALIGFDPGIAWKASTAFTAGEFITDSNYNLQVVKTAGTSAAAMPAAWNTAWGATTTDGTVTWVNSGLGWKPLFVDCSAVVRAGGLPRVRYVLPAQPPPLSVWQSGGVYAAQAFIIDPDGNIQLVKTAGTAGIAPPQWKAAFGQTTTDGSVTWVNNGSASWQPNTSYVANQFIYDANNNMQHVLVAGVSGSTEPDWNGVFLPTTDGAMSWINNGSGSPPVVQPALAQARINQLSEQLSQAMIAKTAFKTLADIFPSLPPSGILPVSAINLVNKTAPWFPPNWTVSAAPVYLEELETVLETGMLMDPIPTAAAAPANTALLEPVEVLVPLPDSVYDPNILVVDTVPPVFYQEQAQATEARNLTLQRIETVQQEINTLLTAVGPNVPSNPNLIDPNAGLTPDELAGRNAPPPYTPASTEIFGTVLQTTWTPALAYTAGQFVMDGNGTIQVALNAGTSAPSAPAWNTATGKTTPDGVIWVCRGNAKWQAATPYAAGQLILDSNGNIAQVDTEGTSGAAAPVWSATTGTVTGAVLWSGWGNPQWLPSNPYTATQMILDANNNVQVVKTAGTSGGTEPAWNQTPGQSTTDGGVTWDNMGQATWKANTSYAVNAVILDSNGNIQNAIVAGTSGNSAPAWPEGAATTTYDGLTWANLGDAKWQANTPYAAPSNTAPGSFIVDTNGYIQGVQVAGTSGATQPTWSDTAGGTTPDAAITWLNNGPWAWQQNTPYILGQFVVDPQGYVQKVTTAGTSASSPPAWLEPETAGQTRQDGTVTWQAGGKTYWQAGHAYTAGQMILDSNNNVQIVKTAGTSGATVPIWDPNLGQPTQDGATGGVLWTNLGHATWQPNTAYTANQVITDSTGSIQTATAGGVTASSPPSWLQPESAGQVTPDGIIWQSGGKAPWQSDFLYAVGQLIVDVNGNVQSVQTGGISGDSRPAWNQNPGQATQDGGVTWNNLGHSTWVASTGYATGQAILDPSGNIQIANVGGASGPTQPAWTEGTGATTPDVSVKWTNEGPVTWVANTAYSVGQIIIDSNGNLETATFVDANGNPEPTVTTGKSGTTIPVWSTTPAGTTTDGAITWVYLPYYSTDLQQIQSVAAQAPYTSTFTDSTGTAVTISLLSAGDLTTLETNGLQALINDLNARISQANDLLDTAFLTAQTDIYRFRQNVMGASAASSLATSSVLANIATGTTASATAENLQSYIGSILPASTTTITGSATGNATTTTTTAPPAYTKPFSTPTRQGVILGNTPIQYHPIPIKFTEQVQGLRSNALRVAINDVKINTTEFSATSLGATEVNRFGAGSTIVTGINKVVEQQASSGLAVGSSIYKAPTFGIVDFGAGSAKAVAGPAQIVDPGKNAAATQTDITSQSPLAGAQLNIRTLTIAERLAQSPSQEAMFYAISNRLSFMQALAALENDLNLVADDLPILVDGLPVAPPTIPVPVPVIRHTFSEFLGASGALIQAQIQSPYLVNDTSEATLFSVGVRVVEQHTMLLRALEARVQQYSDFVTLCTNALQSIQSNIQKAQAYVTQLNNNLTQDRQNLAFTTALLGDEIQQVTAINAQRQQVLATSVQLIAYTRARTLETIDTAPSRQLVPANVANPVPACLQQSVAIPPELREIIGQLREAPVNWLPAAASQVNNLERPVLLQQLALNVQARASQMLLLPQLPSSAAGESGVYASTISEVYTANRQVFRSYVTQRATIQPAALTNLSWSRQVTTVQNIAAINDLISADSVHTEISNTVARIVQQVSSVATCLYTRVSIAQPIDRLTWAEYLTGAGLSVQLQSLAILPGWNQLAYTDRQQMQLLVDWLFLQIDTTNSAATAFMSDVVRTAILIASDVPVDNIIPGSVIARTLPAVGGIVSLSLPSDRIASGMFVNLYSGATLAARAVVSDLDSVSVHATVTDVFTSGTYLDTTDAAHFTTLTPQAVALRPLFG